jgi:RNA polymerase sigma factor (sigma-70 family)
MLLRRLRPKLLAYLRKRSPDIAEDVAHDALIALLLGRDNIADGRAIHAYLFTAARRIQARERLRREVAVVEIDEQTTPEVLACCIEVDRIDVAALLTSCRSRCTATVAEYYLDGRRAAEIARERGISESTVRSQIRHGLVQLRRPLRRSSSAATSAVRALTGRRPGETSSGSHPQSSSHSNT